MLSSLLAYALPRTCAAGALLLLLALPLQAQTRGATYTVNVDGMPPGLVVTARVHAKFCSGGQIQGAETVVPMTESTTTILQPVEGLNGQTFFRTVTVTRYHAQLQPIISSPTPLCALTLQPTGNNLVFGFGVAFVDAADEPVEVQSARFGARTDVGPFTLTERIELQIGDGTFGNTNIAPTIARGPLMNMTFRRSGQFLQTTLPELSFLQPAFGSKLTSALQVKAKIFLSSDNRACITAPPAPLRSNTTVCVGDRPPGPSGFLEHGGIKLIRIDQFLASTDFQFGFTSSFPAGSYTMKSNAVLADPTLPLVDGVPTNVALGRIVPSIRPINIQ